MGSLVVRGCVEYVAKRPQVSDEFGVNPKLVNEVEVTMDKELCCWYEQSQGEVEPVSHVEESLENGLSG